MPSLFRSRRFASLPGYPAGVNEAGFCRDIGFLFLPPLGFVDLAQKTQIDQTCPLTYQPGDKGQGAYPVTSGNFARVNPTNFSLGYTLFALASGTGNAYEQIMDDDLGGTRGFQFRFNNTGGINFIPFTNADGFASVNSNNYSAEELARGVPVIGRVDAAGNIAVFGKGGKFTGSLGAAPRIPGNVGANPGVRFYYSKLAANPLRKPIYFAGALNRVITDDEASAFLNDPIGQVFKPDRRVIYFDVMAGGGTTHNLESAAAAQSTAAGALTLAVPIAGAAVALATANGALSVSIPLAGAAAAQAAASGDLSASGAASLAGSATVSASATGALSLSVPLSGSAVAQALASAGLAHGVPLSGAASGQAAASGSMSINVSLAGSAIAQAAAAAGLTVTNANSLAGAASAQASAAGALTHIVPLTGAALTVSNADGSLTHIVPLSGSAAAASLATGGLDVSVQLDGDALAQAMASAGLTVTGGASLAGDAAAQAAASGTLTLRVNLAGAAVATAIASGALAGTGVLAVTPGYTVRRDARAWRVSRPPRSWRVAA